MNVLLIGGGAEQALARKLGESPQVETIFVVSDNGETPLPKCQVAPVGANDLDALGDWALASGVGLTVANATELLARGIVDQWRAAGLRIVGPTKTAARLGSSKAFAKAFMQAHGIPTAAGEVFDNYRDAIRAVMVAQTIPAIKVSGLAAGEGVFLADCFNDAETALHQIYVEKRFGEAGQVVVIEERLEGPEWSVLALCDETRYHLMPPIQGLGRGIEGEEWRVEDMVALALPNFVTPTLLHEVDTTIFQPVLAGLREQGSPLRSPLQVDMIQTAGGPKVLGFRCHLGTPEAQAVIPLLASDVLDLLLACAEGRLGTVEPRWQEERGSSAVMGLVGAASPGPG